MQVGTTKDQGLYNKPSAAVHPGAFAAGTLPQYNTVLPSTPVSSEWSLCLDPIYSSEKNPQYLLNSRLGWPQIRFARFEEGINPLFLPGVEPSYPDMQSVADTGHYTEDPAWTGG